MGATKHEIPCEHCDDGLACTLGGDCSDHTCAEADCGLCDGKGKVPHDPLEGPHGDCNTCSDCTWLVVGTVYVAVCSSVLDAFLRAMARSAKDEVMVCVVDSSNRDLGWVDGPNEYAIKTDIHQEAA